MLGGVFFLFVFVKNSWVHEDAFIIFRTVDQFFAGNGLRWNPHERVQVYTSVLPFFALLLTRLFSADLFVNAILLDLLFCAGAIFFAYRCIGHGRLFVLMLLALISSKGFMDYSSGGLGNSAAYFLLAAFLFFYFRAFSEKDKDDRSLSPMTALTAVCSLVPLVRHDLVLLVAPAYAYAWFFAPENVGAPWKKRMFQAALVCAPLLAWSLFSFFYYGNFLPNTALSKLNAEISREEFLWHGVAWLYMCLSNDLATMLLLVASAGVLLFGALPFYFIAGGGMAYWFYWVYVGGDYMMSRQLGMPLFFLVVAVAVFFCKRKESDKKQGGWKNKEKIFAAVLIVYGFVYPYSPLIWPLNSLDYGTFIRPIIYGIMDQKVEMHHATSIQARLKGKPIYKPIIMPEFYRQLPDGAMIMSMRDGAFPYHAGINKIFISYAGLADPFISRLPFYRMVRDDFPEVGEENPLNLPLDMDYYWMPGHLLRRIPKNYPEVLKNDTLRLETPELQAYWEKVKFVTQGKLFSWERIKTAALLNVGRYDYLLEDYRRKASEQASDYYKAEFIYDVGNNSWWLPGVAITGREADGKIRVYPPDGKRPF